MDGKSPQSNQPLKLAHHCQVFCNHLILADMASLTRWNARMLCLLLKVECGSVALVTTDLLSSNIYDLDPMGTPRYLSVYLISMICSVAVLAATNSDPYVAVSTVACFLEYQSVGV